MPKICYQAKTFSRKSLDLIEKCNAVIAAYEAQGFDLTLRQLFYQMVSRDILPNTQAEYKRLGSIINDARLAGMVDWERITDRTRTLRGVSHWENPQQIMDAVAEQYRRAKWETQPYRVEVWIEKDALVGVIASVCERLDVDYFSCRGYTSQSEMWAAGMRLRRHMHLGKRMRILHLGDHDPSGKDMTRDIQERLMLFTGGYVDVARIALTMEQIRAYAPPPNPVKLTDSRSGAYASEFGSESWELDALEPTVLSRLIEDEIMAVRDLDAWKEAVRVERTHRKQLHAAAQQWDDLTGYLDIEEDEEGDEGE